MTAPRQVSSHVGYFSWGGHNNPPLGPDYAIDGTVRFGTNSQWYVITTIESFNGHRTDQYFGTYVKWTQANAFGGTNYSNTPVAMLVNSSEPGSPGGVNGVPDLFALWESGRPFGNCAWIRPNLVALAIGDPFVSR